MLAFTAQPIILPESPFIPEGMSIDIIFLDLFTSEITDFIFPTMGLLIPVPNKQSIKTEFFLVLNLKILFFLTLIFLKAFKASPL